MNAYIQMVTARKPPGASHGRFWELLVLLSDLGIGLAAFLVFKDHFLYYIA